MADTDEGAAYGTPVSPSSNAPIENPPKSYPIPPKNPATGLAAVPIATLIGAAVILAFGVWGIAQIGGKAQRAAYMFAFIVLLSAAIMNANKLVSALGGFGVK